jgi:hypothetical protein
MIRSSHLAAPDRPHVRAAGTDDARRRRLVRRVAGAAAIALFAGITVGWAQAHASSPAGSGGARLASTSQGVPAPPGDVTLAASPTDNEVTASWQPSPGAARYDIGVFEGTGAGRHQVGAVACDAPCTSEVLDADPGSLTSVVVDAANSAGTSQLIPSNTVQVAQPCPLACLTVDGRSVASSFARWADGFIAPWGSQSGTGVLTTLAPSQWRTNRSVLGSTPPASFRALQGAAITDVLSDDWQAAHSVGGYAQTPWSEWSAYSQFVYDDVKQVEALGAQEGFSVAYWEVQNEPFGGYYYSDSANPPASETVANFEEQFLVAYQAIKKADPSAQVIGPSLVSFEPAQGIDMATFLAFCAANGIQLAAVSFHDNNYFPLPGWYAADGQPAQPGEVDAEVAQLRQMIASLPALGHPAILVNEYGDPYTSPLPGWAVGRIAALDAAGVAGANRSCWNDCDSSALDGLLTDNGSEALPAYWVYNFYASMRGSSVPVTSTYTDVTGLATVDTTGTVRILVGRHQACTRAISPYCPTYPAQAATIDVEVPGGTSAQVTQAAIPMGSTASSPLDSLSPTTSVLPVVDGQVTITTPALHDGDAVEITVTPQG